MSQTVSQTVRQANLSSTWKQEVNRRVAAHLNRKGDTGSEPRTAEEARPSASPRAAEAAARVAARYANAPSYSEMLAGEARAALRAAEAVSRAALHAQAAAASILAGIEAASGSAAWERQDEAELAEAQETQGAGVHELRVEEWRRQAQPEEQDAPDSQYSSGSPYSLGEEAIGIAEPVQPVHANLIEFPREPVTPRRIRPLRDEMPYAEAVPEAQLSIFEVDPGAISTQPEAAEAGNGAAAPAPAGQTWTGPEWSSIELEAEPEEELFEEPEPRAAPAPEIELAPLNLRLLASVVDGTLMAAALLAAAAVAAKNVTALPGPRVLEMGALLALLAVGAAYQVFFLTLARATPGMKYAHIRFCTFDGYSPNGAQRTGRLAALLLSVLPLGLGVAWALFDEDHLSWHDRLSRTYLRRY